MSQFRLPGQTPVSWGRINQSGEGGTNAAHIDGSGLQTYNYLMHTLLLPAPADVSLQTRLRAKLIDMNVGDTAFEGAAVLHRGFRITGTEPNINVDTQVWSSNPSAGGKRAWISGDHSDFKTYNFVNTLPEVEGMDYVTWELVVRAPGQIIVDDVQCRHYYGKLYPMNVEGKQRTDTSPGLSLETVDTDLSDNAYRCWVVYLQTDSIKSRQGQNLIFNTSGFLNGIGTQFKTGVSVANEPAITTRGFFAKMRRSNEPGVYDYIEIFSDRTEPNYNEVRFNRALTIRATHDYDQRELLAYIRPHPPFDYDISGVLFVEHKDIVADLTVADFVAASQ